jgi:hypothetical protein
MSKNIILTNQEIEHKIKENSLPIYETFVDEKSCSCRNKQWIRFLQKK